MRVLVTSVLATAFMQDCRQLDERYIDKAMFIQEKQKKVLPSLKLHVQEARDFDLVALSLQSYSLIFHLLGEKNVLTTRHTITQA